MIKNWGFLLIVFFFQNTLYFLVVPMCIKHFIYR